MYDKKQKTKTTNTIKLRLNIYYIKMCVCTKKRTNLY